jgi:protein-S-isoprenylcysteine O-methyltransferase Ste14
MSEESAAVPNVIAPPPLIFGAAFALGQILQFIRPVPLLPQFATSLRRPAAGAMIAGGLAVGLWGFRTMQRAGTSADPYEPSTALVEDGPFQYSRNPLYLTLTAIYIGINLLRNNFWGLLLLPALLAVLQRGVIEREERYLHQRFGENYRDFTERVPRWL